MSCHRISNRTVRLDLETLEDRCLPAAGLTTNLSYGLLSITDTRSYGSVVIRETHGDFLINGSPHSFAASRVASINIKTPNGHELVDIVDATVPGQQNITVPITINTGLGHDLLVGLDIADTIKDPQLSGGWSMHYESAELWQALGGAGGRLGHPIGNERSAGDTVGRITFFQHGAIYWTAALGAFAVDGGVYQKWQAMGGVTSRLGAPVGNVQESADGLGRIGFFKNGAIYWTAAHGAYEIDGAIYSTWKALGGETGALGEPISNERVTAGGGRFADFQYGSIQWTPGKGVQVNYKYRTSTGNDDSSADPAPTFPVDQCQPGANPVIQWLSNTTPVDQSQSDPSQYDAYWAQVAAQQQYEAQAQAQALADAQAQAQAQALADAQAQAQAQALADAQAQAQAQALADAQAQAQAQALADAQAQAQAQALADAQAQAQAQALADAQAQAQAQALADAQAQAQAQALADAQAQAQAQALADAQAQAEAQAQAQAQAQAEAQALADAQAQAQAQALADAQAQAQAQADLSAYM
jgi:hypothetical protein